MYADIPILELTELTSNVYFVPLIVGFTAAPSTVNFIFSIILCISLANSRVRYTFPSLTSKYDTSSNEFLTILVPIELFPEYNVVFFILYLPFSNPFGFTSSFSKTVTFIVLVATNPSESATLYVTSYVPGLVVSTLLTTSNFDVKSPSSLSVATPLVAPLNASNSSPTYIVLSFTFITGALFFVSSSGVSDNFTFTVNECGGIFGTGTLTL